jgi:hypothetical protein
MTKPLANAIIPGSKSQVRGVGGRFANMAGRGDDAARIARGSLRGRIGLQPDGSKVTPQQGLRNVASARILRTANPNWYMLSIKMRQAQNPSPQKGRANAYSGNPSKLGNVAFYISRKVVGTEVVANILRQVDVGDALSSITYIGVRKFANQNFYNPYRQISRIIRGSLRSFLPLLSEQNEEVNQMELGELFCSDTSVSESDGLIWKVALPVGELKLSPGWDGKPVHRPLRVVGGTSDDPKAAIGLQDIVDAFNENAVQHVTVPLSHADKVHENTGFVRQLRVVDLPDGRKALSCGIEFTEPEIREKVRRGTIANVSVGVQFDYQKKDNGKRYRAALQHVALTNHPWVPGMPPFGAQMSESTMIVPLEVADEAPEAVDSWETAQDIWARRDMICDALDAGDSEFELVDFDRSFAIVTTEDGTRMRVPYVVEEGVALLALSNATPVEADAEDIVVDQVEGETTGEEEQPDALMEAEATLTDESLADVTASKPTELEIAQSAREQLVTTNTREGGDHMSDEMIEMSEDVKAKLSRLEELEAKVRESEVEARITELKELGLSEYPGFLKEVRELMLADDGGPAAVLLSEESGERSGITVTDIVERFVNSLPRDEEGKFKLSEQQIDVGAIAPQIEDSSTSETSEADTAAAARDFLYQR